ncbi:helix-turn-helix transcriptional regulator [Pendulispora brunnea]|uniref:Helix-turn-helix transcriptional regulator n=1 Tax=Pendulispora brunnea TaxID=2905690 RepID=A0ABZ2JXH8_9BACT
MDRDGLAEFLRRRREALQPRDVGLVGLEQGRRRRRTLGLRREEVAELASISADFYKRLEQGRGPRPSEETVEAIARALLLTRDERDHLFRLAGRQPPPRRYRSEQASPGLLSVLDCCDTPAQIVSDLGVTLKQNQLAEALLGIQTGYTGFARSTIFRWFTDPDERRRFPSDDHAWHSQSYTAHLRAVHNRCANDFEAKDLVHELRRRSTEFAEIWDQHDVALRADTRKRILHPTVGLLTLDCHILTSQNQMENLIVFTAVRGSEDAKRLALVLEHRKDEAPEPYLEAHAEP